jgi:hypothetical protein
MPPQVLPRDSGNESNKSLVALICWAIPAFAMLASGEGAMRMRPENLGSGLADGFWYLQE